jgi:hypothetical protein
MRFSLPYGKRDTQGYRWWQEAVEMLRGVVGIHYAIVAE